MPNIVNLKMQFVGNQSYIFASSDPQTILAGNSNGNPLVAPQDDFTTNFLEVDMTQADEDGNTVYTGQGRFVVLGSENDDIFYPNKFAPNFGDNLNAKINENESSLNWLKLNLNAGEEASKAAGDFISQLISKGYNGSGRIEAGGGNDIVHQGAGGFAFDGGAGVDELQADTLNYSGNNNGAAQMSIFKVPDQPDMRIVTWGKSGAPGTIGETEDFIVLTNTEFVRFATNQNSVFDIDLNNMRDIISIRRDANGNYSAIDYYDYRNSGGIDPVPPREIRARELPPAIPPTPPIPPTPHPGIPEDPPHPPETSMIEEIRGKMQMALSDIPEGTSVQAANNISGGSKNIELG